MTFELMEDRWWLFKDASLHRHYMTGLTLSNTSCAFKSGLSPFANIKHMKESEIKPLQHTSQPTKKYKVIKSTFYKTSTQNNP